MSISVFNVLDYGAKADSITLDTLSVQKAIDAAFECGGGTVLLGHLCFVDRLFKG